jgi:hypothetical protein
MRRPTVQDASRRTHTNEFRHHQADSFENSWTAAPREVEGASGLGLLGECGTRLNGVTPLNGFMVQLYGTSPVCIINDNGPAHDGSGVHWVCDSGRNSFDPGQPCTTH